MAGSTLTRGARDRPRDGTPDCGPGQRCLGAAALDPRLEADVGDRCTLGLGVYVMSRTPDEYHPSLACVGIGLVDLQGDLVLGMRDTSAQVLFGEEDLVSAENDRSFMDLVLGRQRHRPIPAVVEPPGELKSALLSRISPHPSRRPRRGCVAGAYAQPGVATDLEGAQADSSPAPSRRRWRPDRRPSAFQSRDRGSDRPMYLGRFALFRLPPPACQPPGGAGIRTLRPYRGAMSAFAMMRSCSATCRSCARPRVRSQFANLGGSCIPRY